MNTPSVMDDEVCLPRVLDRSPVPFSKETISTRSVHPQTNRKMFLFLVGSTVALLYFLFVHNKYLEHAIGSSYRPDLKSPKPVPLFGNIDLMISRGDRILELFMEWKGKYGLGSTFTLPFFRLIDISKPEWIEYIQKTNFKNYVKGDDFGKNVKDILGEKHLSIQGGYF